MRVYISADIEGVATTTLWEETRARSNPSEAAPHLRQMTLEVKAACEGAIAAGADYILVRDAHGNGTNIDITMLPECTEVIRNWSGEPYGMVAGVDSSFDAAMYIGYHAAAGRDGTPLSHTMTLDTIWLKLNGEKMSEFQMYSYACNLVGVPSVLLTGDKTIVEDSKGMHPLLKTVITKDGFGGMTKNRNPGLVCKEIKAAAEAALKQDLSKGLIELPKEFTFEVCYKEQKMATAKSFFPGFHKIDDNVIQMKTTNFMDILVATRFIV